MPQAAGRAGQGWRGLRDLTGMAAIAAFEGRPHLAAIRVPTLVIVGTHDLATPKVHGEALANARRGMSESRVGAH